MLCINIKLLMSTEIFEQDNSILETKNIIIDPNMKLYIKGKSVLTPLHIQYIFTTIYIIIITLYYMHKIITQKTKLLFAILAPINIILIILFYIMNLNTFMIHNELYQHMLFIPVTEYVSHNILLSQWQNLQNLLFHYVGNINAFRTPLIYRAINGYNQDSYIDLCSDIKSIYTLLQFDSNINIVRFINNTYAIFNLICSVVIIYMVFKIIASKENSDNKKDSIIKFIIFLILNIIVYYVRMFTSKYVNDLMLQNPIYAAIYDIVNQNNIESKEFVWFTMPSLYI